MIVRIAQRAACALSVLLVLAGGAAAESRLDVGYQPTLDLMPAFVAKQQGMFTRHGLDVALTAGNGAVQVSGVVAKSFQIGNPTVPQLLQAIDSGLDLVIIAGCDMLSPAAAEFAMVVRSGQDLRGARDFVGHKVGVNTVGSFLHVLFLQWLKNNGVDLRQVTFVEVPFPQMNDVMRQGTVDAVLAVEPFVSRMVQAHTGAAQDAFLRDFPSGMPVAVYAAERSWAEAHRGQIEAFRAALQEGTDFLAAHPEQGRADTLVYLKMPPEVLAGLKTPDLQVDVPLAGLAEWVRILHDQKLVGDLDAAHLLWR